MALVMVVKRVRDFSGCGGRCWSGCERSLWEESDTGASPRGVLENGLGGLPDFVTEFGGFEDGGVGAPAEGPAFDFGGGGESEGEGAAGWGGVVDEFLGGMPLAFGDEAGGPGVESDDDTDFGGGIAGVDAEGALEVVGWVEVGGWWELGGADAEVGDAGQGEGADAGVVVGPGGGIVGEQVPFLAVIPEVPGVDAAGPGFGVLEALVGEGDLQVVPEGLDELVEEVGGDVLVSEVAEGDEAGETVERIGLLVVEAALEAVEAIGEDLFEWGAAVGGEGLTGDQEGEEFRFGEGGAGEGLGRVLEVEAVLGRVILDLDAVVGAEEFDVASDGAWGDFEFRAEGGGVGVSALADGFEELAETDVEAADGAVSVVG